MARILYAWELGNGLGHTHLLAQLARHPRLAAHEALFALPHRAPSGAYLDALGLAHVQAPLLRRPPARDDAADFRAGSFADVLALHGYADAGTLHAQVDAWRRLLEASGADLVIADFAPTLMLAARDRVPLVAAGTPFGLPPAHLDAFPALPALHDGQLPTPTVPQAHLHDIVSAALADDDAPASSLPGWFRAEARIPLVFPLLDPYRELRPVPAAGPVRGRPAPLPAAPAPRVLAYLADEYPALDAVLDALDALQAPVDVYVRGDTSATRTPLAGRRLNRLPMPFALDTALARASLVVHHGAIGIAQDALAAGRPQLVLPFHLENTLTAMRLLGAGVALGVGHRESAALPAMLRRALDDGELAGRARALATDLQQVDWCGADRVAAEVAHALIRDARGVSRRGP
jgi:UDP:flavonoid glycosyltransferase YjiC (YdhE family)